MFRVYIKVLDKIIYENYLSLWINIKIYGIISTNIYVEIHTYIFFLIIQSKWKFVLYLYESYRWNKMKI